MECWLNASTAIILRTPYTKGSNRALADQSKGIPGFSSMLDDHISSFDGTSTSYAML